MFRRQSKNKSKSRIRRWVNRILGTIVVLVFFLAVVIIVLSLIYPPDRLGRDLSRQLETNLGRPVSIGRLAIRPWGSIDAHDLSFGYTEAEGGEGPFFTLKQMSIRYNLFAMFRRRLDLTKIEVTDPQVHLIPLVPKSVKADPDTVQPLTSLPFSIGLFQLNLEDFHLDMSMTDSVSQSSFAVTGIRLDVSDVHFPSNYFQSPDKIRGKIRLYAESGTLAYSHPHLSINADFNLELKAHWKSDKHWDLDGHLFLHPKRSQSPDPVGFELSCSGIGFGELLNINLLDILLAGRRVCQISGQVEGFEPDALCNLQIQSDPLPIQSIFHSFDFIIPDSIQTSLDDFEIAGSLYPIQGQFRGPIDELSFEVGSSIQDLFVHHKAEGWSIDGIETEITIDGLWKSDAFNDGKIRLKTALDRLVSPLSDTTHFALSDLELTANSTIDTAFFPFEGMVQGKISDILGGVLNLDLKWNNGSTDNWANGLELDGFIHLDSLQLSSLPDMSPELSGNVEIENRIVAHGVNDIRIVNTVQSPGVFYPFEEDTARTPPLRLSTFIAMATDTAFQFWNMKSAELSFNDLITAWARGKYSGLQKTFQIQLDSLNIINRHLISLLPPALQETWEGSDIWGKEVVSVAASGRIIDDSTQISMQGQVQLVDVGLNLPDHFLRIEGIGSNIQFEGNPLRLNGYGALSIKKIENPSLRPEPIGPVDFTFRGEYLPDRFTAQNVAFGIPSFGLQANVNGTIDNLPNEPYINMNGDFEMDTGDTLEVVTGIKILGHLTGQISGRSIDSKNQSIGLQGQITVDSLDVTDGLLFHMKKLRGRIPFSINADLANGTLIPDTTYRPLLWWEYENQRPAIRRLSSDAGDLRILALDVMGYQVSDFIMDVRIARGYVQVPWFNIKVLDGNFGGSIRVDLATGKLNDIGYEIRGHASRFNSAVLIGKPRKDDDEEETELNASMAFSGKGIDPSQSLNVEGFFHITQIGPNFASTLLKGLDPKGADRSIRMTRRFLNSGWKPKLFSFELRHGYVYPSLELDQPWFSPVRLPERLEYGRLPLEFFMETSNTTSK